jgi:hypothetical protein
MSKQSKPTVIPFAKPDSATTPRKNGKFIKGAPKPPTAGRARGKRNKTTVMLKEAILTAAELCGADGKGKDGMVGYLKMLAVKERPLFTRLLERVLPMQLNVKDTTDRLLTPEEAAQQLRERGLPVPPSLLELNADAIASKLNEDRDGHTDEDDDPQGGPPLPTTPDDSY